MIRRVPLLAAMFVAALTSIFTYAGSAHAATICTAPKLCSTLALTVGRVWSEGDDPLNVTRYDVVVQGSGLKPGSPVWWVEHHLDGTFSGGFTLGLVGPGGRFKGTISPICPSWYVVNPTIGGKVISTAPSGEISERWVARDC